MATATAAVRGCFAVTRGRSAVAAARSVVQVQAGAFRTVPTRGMFGGLFGGKKEKREGKNDDVLKMARSAKRGTEVAPATAPEGLEIATVAGGCFWGLELAYQRLPGVTKTSVGYTAGQTLSPTYEVCSGRTGHTEGVQMYYNPAECSFERILEEFFDKVDPTTLNRQGNDSGTQYRSVIFYHNEAQKAAAEKAVEAANAALAAGTFRRVLGKTVATTVQPAEDYYVAEEYHQQYLSKGGRMSNAQSAEKNCKDKIRCYG